MGIQMLKLRFQSTPSVGRATSYRVYFESTVGISIHALRGEGDTQGIIISKNSSLFQSTPSVGRATIR